MAKFTYHNVSNYGADEYDVVLEALADMAPAVVCADNITFDPENDCYRGTIVVKLGPEYDNNMFVSMDELQEAADTLNDEVSTSLMYQDEMRSVMHPDFSLTENWIIPDKYKYIRDKYCKNYGDTGCVVLNSDSDDDTEPDTNTKQ